MTATTGAEGVVLSRRLVVVIKSGTLSVPLPAQGEGFGVLHPSVTLGAPGVALLEALAAGPGSPDQAIDAITARFATPADPLRSLVDRLAERGLLLPADTEVPEPPTGHRLATVAVSAPDRPVEAVPAPTAPLALATPRVLLPGPDGFALLDHDGRTLLTLDTSGVIALQSFSRFANAREAFRHQRIALGDHAPDQATFDDLVRRIVASGAVHRSDTDEPAETLAEELYRTAIEARVKLGAGVAAQVAEVHADAQARAERVGHRLIPVVPVTFQNENIPLALGLIFAYAKVHDGGKLRDLYEFTPRWTFEDDDLPGLVAEPAVVMFSNYIWTHGRCLDISARAKELNPLTVTVHGGPDTPKYPADVQEYFRINPHVDVAVHGEGEITAAEMLDALAPSLLAGTPDLTALADVPGLSYRDGDRVVTTAARDRIEDLDILPSPYLTGEFEAFRGVPGMTGLFESNRGCPYGCTFCDWGSATTSRIRKFDLDRVLGELTWMAESGFKVFGNADANFGIFPRDVEIARHAVDLRAATGHPDMFGANYAKNTIKHLRPIIELLADGGILSYGVLSLQTMDADTLEVVARKNIKLEKYEELAVTMDEAQLPLFVDLMLGLPGQSLRSFRHDLQECIDREVQARIAPTELLVNSPMNDPAYRAEHQIELSSSPVKAPNDTKPAFVMATRTFSRDDRDTMMRLRQTFLVNENFGILRQIVRYVRSETGRGELAVLEDVLGHATAAPDRWPAIWTALELMPNVMAAPGSWQRFIEEVGAFLVAEVGVRDDAALATVLAVQHALLPDHSRLFPVTLDLPHDYAGWFADVSAAKNSGHRHDWHELVTPLRDRGPGTFRIDDPDWRATRALGASFSNYGFGINWEMDSPVARSFLVKRVAGLAKVGDESPEQVLEIRGA